MYRLNLDPTAEGGTGATATVMLTNAQYQELISARDQLATVRTEQEKAIRAAEAERLKAITDLDAYRAEVEKQQKAWEKREADALKRHQETEAAWHRAEKQRALTAALAGAEFVDDNARADVAALLETKFEAKSTAEGVAVLEVGTGRPAAEAIKEMLPSKYAYALKPTTTGGSGATGTRQSNGSARPGALVVSQSRLSNPEYAAEMQPKIAEAYRNGSLVFSD